MTETTPEVARPRRCWIYAIILFFGSPLIGEYLLGNLPITLLPVVFVLAPLYGGGALLVREVARRFRLGWTGLLLLALAYAVVEEAFTTQSLFNPNYLGLRLLDFGFIPAIGMSSWWTIFVLGIHVIWSMATPIALVEAMSGPMRREPWLGTRGIVVTTVLFALGCLATTSQQLKADPFRSTPAQVIGAVVVVVALVAAAFVFCRRVAPTAPRGSAQVPSPRLLLVYGLGLGSVFVIIAAVLKARLPIMLSVGGMVTTLAIMGIALRRWSRSAAWTPLSELAFAGGLLLTYAWYGFVQVPSVGTVSPWVDAAGNLVFATGAVVLLVRAWKTSMKPDTTA